MVFFSLARNNYIMAEVEGYVGHYLSGVLDEASDRSSFILVHTGSRGVSAGIRTNVSASQGSGANRDENGRKRSVNTKTVSIFIFFIGNKIGIGNSGIGNDIGISETSKTKVRRGKYTGNGRNLKYHR
jgi:hypothetical protein